MKNVLLALALCMSFSGFAQVLNVASVNKVPIPANPNAKVAGISPNGDYLLLSTSTNVGLTKFDLKTTESKVLTNARGAGFTAQISSDGASAISVSSRIISSGCDASTPITSVAPAIPAFNAKEPVWVKQSSTRFPLQTLCIAARFFFWSRNNPVF